MGKFIDLSGKRFGRLVAVSPVRRGKFIHWLCQCDCGKTVTPIGSTLRNGTSQSCGCARTEWINGGFRKVNVQHGLFGTRIYRIWAGIITRCYDINSRDYHNYGGRGIGIHPLWRHDPLKFYKDVGDPPDGMSLDRKNNDGDYEPGNVRWSTQTEQANNRRSNVNLTYKGVTKTQSEWAREIGISPTGLSDRLLVMSLEDAIETPVRKRKANK